MAGAIKHMERSHRSHRNKADAFVFTQFSRRAYTNKYMKEWHKARKQTVGQKLAAAIKEMMPKKREG